jgi:hypothetical protein
MSRFLDTRGAPVLAVGICDRCKMKRRLVDLSADRNSPGLRVCNQGCNDEYDPWRLPARKAEDISVQYPRPEEDISV